MVNKMPMVLENLAITLAFLNLAFLYKPYVPKRYLELFLFSNSFASPFVSKRKSKKNYSKDLEIHENYNLYCKLAVV